MYDVNYLLAYDITHTKRRNKVLRLAQSFALTGQKSLYESKLSTAVITQYALWMRLQIEPKEDKLLFIPIRNNVRYLGRPSLGLEAYGAVVA